MWEFFLSEGQMNMAGLVGHPRQAVPIPVPVLQTVIRSGVFLRENIILSVGYFMTFFIVCALLSPTGESNLFL